MKDRNTPLRLERLSRGWTQVQLAVKAEVSLSTIERAERGEGLRLDNILRLCACLSKKPRELGLFVDEDSDQDSEGGQNSGEAPYIDQKEATEQDIESNEEMDRRKALEILGVTGSALLMKPQNLLSPPLWERLSKALDKPSSIDTSTLDHLEVITQGSWRLIPEVAGIVSRNLLNYVLEQLQDVTQLLEVPQPTAIYKRLCSIAGELALIAGVMSGALQDNKAARAYYTVSIKASREAGNNALCAVGLTRLSLISIHNDQVYTALPLMQEAQRLTAQSGTTTTRSWVAAVTAEVYANTNNQIACLRALEQANAIGDNGLPGDDPYYTAFNPSLLAGYKGVCYMRLGQPETAQTALQGVLTQQLTPSSIYQHCYARADLATSYTQQREISEACNHAGQVLTLAAQTKSTAILHRIYTLRRELEPWKKEAPVKALDKQIRLAEGVVRVQR